MRVVDHLDSHPERMLHRKSVVIFTTADSKRCYERIASDRLPRHANGNRVVIDAVVNSTVVLVELGEGRVAAFRDAGGRDARGVAAAAGTAAGALGVGAVVAGAKGRLGLEGHTIPVIEVRVEGDGRLWDPPAWAAEVLQSGPGFGYSW